MRAIIVDGPADTNGDQSVEMRVLDDEPWHVASYDQTDGLCRLQRGPHPTAVQITFTPGEIIAAGIYTEGTQSEITIKSRERSLQLRDLARKHFTKNGRLSCATCGWSAPAGLDLNSPIVEIHHGVAISSLPSSGQTLSFSDAIKYLTPLCPNCHRVIHAKKGGGAFTLDEVSRAAPTCLAGRP